MSEFKVNRYITLRLENRKTEIYVLNKKFIQCKFILINIPVERVTSFNEIKSIDDAESQLDHSLHELSIKEYKISSEEEFWAHCSNLQVWAEDNYNTRLLHRNIAFPLLRKLTEIGDPLAGRVFKDEIAKRLKSNSLSVIFYLLEGGYLNYFNKDEFDSFLTDLKNDNPKLKEIFTVHITNLLEKNQLKDVLSGYRNLIFLIIDNRFELLESMLNPRVWLE